jgi:hypothetical protein
MGSSRPRHSTGRKAGSRSVHNKTRSSQTTQREADAVAAQYAEDRDPLARLSNAIALVETVEAAMRTYEAERGLGSICVCLQLACRQLARAHSAVDHAIQGTHT